MPLNPTISHVTHHDNVCDARTLAPSASTVHARVIDELREDKFARLMCGGTCKDGDHERGRPNGVPIDADGVQVLEDYRVQGIEQTLGTQHGGVDADSCLWCGHKVRTERGSGGEEVRAREAAELRLMWLKLEYFRQKYTPDTGSDCDLAEEVEPASNP